MVGFKEIESVVIKADNPLNLRVVALMPAECGNLQFWEILPEFPLFLSNSYPGTDASRKLPGNFPAMWQWHP